MTADTTVLRAGGTGFHSGMFSKGPLSSTRRTVGLDPNQGASFPHGSAGPSVAAAMLDEVERPHYVGPTALPFER